MAVIDTTTKELVCLDRSNQVEYALQAGRLQALAAFRPDSHLRRAERHGRAHRGDPPAHVPPRVPLPDQQRKAAVIDALSLAFERGELRVLEDKVLLGELLAFQAERLPSGLMRYSAPRACTTTA